MQALLIQDGKFSVHALILHTCRISLGRCTFLRNALIFHVYFLSSKILLAAPNVKKCEQEILTYTEYSMQILK